MDSPNLSYTPTSVESSLESSRNQSKEGSASASRSSSRPPKKNARIHWQSEGESMDIKKQKATFNLRDHDTEESKKLLPRAKRRNSNRSRSQSPVSRGSFSQDVNEALKSLHAGSNEKDLQDMVGVTEEDVHDNTDGHSFNKAIAQKTAQTKAQRLSRDLGIKSAPGSQLPSPIRSPPPSPPASDQRRTSINLEGIPLERLTTRRQKYSIEDDTDTDESDDGQRHKKQKGRFHKAARRLIRRHTGTDAYHSLFRVPAAASSQTSLRSGQITPEHERDHVGVYSSFTITHCWNY